MKLNSGASNCRLFETLDPTLRRVYLPSRQEALLSDTVGFISNLPTALVTAFRVRFFTTNILFILSRRANKSWKPSRQIQCVGGTKTSSRMVCHI